MAVTFTKDDTGSQMRVSRRGVRSRFQDTYNHYRSYMRFDVSSLGLVVGDVDYVELHTKVASVFDSTSYRLRSAKSTASNWGTTLDATSGDYTSTSANIEDTKTISSTGWKIWSVNKNNLDFSGTQWFRIACAAAASIGDYDYIEIYSQNAASANRPFLRFFLASAGGIVDLPMMGVGTMG